MRWKICSNEGVEKATVDKLELRDEWMSECFLTVSVKTAEPVQFAIGDYIDYRGERYSINYDPNVLKKARRGTYGEGFTYESMKFVNEAQGKIVRCDFTDLVLDDNQTHYTGLPTFPFYCESVDDLLDRIQACLEELYPGEFVLIGLNTVRNAQRGNAVGRPSDFDAAYRKYVDPTGEANTSSYGKTSVALTASNITCWDALTKIHSDFELNFIQRGNVVVAGINGTFTTSTFRYGKGNGLSEIERISDSSQQIVTRLKAYGSDENLPTRYYAELNLRVFARVESIIANYSTTGQHYAHFYLDLDFNSKYFTDRSHSYPGQDDSPNYIVRMQANGVTVTGYVSKNHLVSERCVVYSEYVGGSDDDRDESDEAAMNAFSEAIKQGDTVYFVGGIVKSAFGSANKDYATDNLPDNMAVSRLMLPGFPNQSLYDWVKGHGGTGCDDTSGQATYNGFTGIFSKDKHRPWIQSMKALEYGVRPGNIYFDGSEETDNIHPTLEGMTNDGHAVDEVVEAEQITDNGVFGEGKVPNFTITIPDLGFDLLEVYSDGASIDMKDGMCGSRSFKLARKPKRNSGGQWVCTVERVRDDAIDLWFPYNDFQIKAGDHYVLSGIEMPSRYVDAASERLLAASIEALQKNDTTKYTYQPKIDELWMARQHDAAVLALPAVGTAETSAVSLHDSLHAGDVFLFEDADLGIDEGIIIDVLTIKENGNNGIPTYEVTLRDEKEVSTIQRLIDKAVTGTTVSGGGGGYSRKQIEDLIANYGGERFLSRLNADAAAGKITFREGLAALALATFGEYLRGSNGDGNDSGAAVLPDGTGDFLNLIVRQKVLGDLDVDGAVKAVEMIFRDVLKSVNGMPGLDGRGVYIDGRTGSISAESITVSGWMQIRKLIYNYLEIMERDYQFSGGGDIERVVDNGDGTYTLYMHKEAEGKHTGFAAGDIMYGKMDRRDSETGAFEHGTSWLRVTDVTLNDGEQPDTVTAVMWDDAAVPGGRNFPPEAQMTVAQRGNVTNEERQSFWELSGTDHRITHYWHVDQPILRADNYAACFGILPEILDNAGVLPSTRDKSMPSLYVNTLFFEHEHHIYYPARIVKEDRGEWTQNPTVTYTGDSGTYTPDGTLDDALIRSWAGTYTSGQPMSEPYHHEHITKNQWLTHRLSSSYASWSDKKLYDKIMIEWHDDRETSRAWRYDGLWECQTEGATTAPWFGSRDWTVVTNPTVALALTITRRFLRRADFRNNQVGTTLGFTLQVGSSDLTALVHKDAVEWTRMTAGATDGDPLDMADKAWNQNSGYHRLEIPVSSGDLPANFWTAKEVTFRCTVTLDGLSSPLTRTITLH